IDLLGLDHADAVADRLALDVHDQLLALLGAELLRVVDAGAAIANRQDRGCGDDRTGERAHAGFIDAGDVRESLLPQLLLVTAQVAQTLPFGAHRVPAALDGFEDRARAR